MRVRAARLFKNLLTRILGRLPIGWLQLSHNRTRLFAAIAGVTFANMLIFMQLGFQGSIARTVLIPYNHMNADILIYGKGTDSISDAQKIPRIRMYQALSTPGVKSATPLYVGLVEWSRLDGASSRMTVFGIVPEDHALTGAGIDSQLNVLKLRDNALVDRLTLHAKADAFGPLTEGKPLKYETNGRTLTMRGLIDLGGGFTTDGYLLVSDQTFMRLFPGTISGGPNYILVRTDKGANPDEVVAELRKRLPQSDSIVQTLKTASDAELSYQLTKRPVGIIFGFGVFMGVLVGIIIVYQVLSTDVADHLKEYATFKAMGYSQSLFLSIVFEEAVLLAVLGFGPGISLSLLFYSLISDATGLNIQMDAVRAISVFAGTIAMCSFSGAIATRKLANANPADLF